MGLLLGSAVALGSSYIMYRDINKKNIKISKEKRELSKDFNMLLDSMGSEGENKLEQRFKILKYIPMEYGCDCVFSIPLGKDLSDFHKILPQLKLILNANVIAELSTSKKCIYARIHYRDKSIADKWDVRIKWYELMFNSNGKDSKYRNKFYETFSIKSVTEEKYGYKMVLNVPVGLEYTSVLDNLKQITNAYKCNVWGEYNREKAELTMTVIKHEMPDDYPFTPVKTKADEFYIGMTYDYRKVIVPLDDYCHVMYSGMTSMGKTVALLMAITNLVYFHTPKELELYALQISGKQDLQIFKNIAHCKYYAKTIEDVEKVLNYLVGEMKKRNNMLFEGDEYIASISDWNKKHPDNKFSEIYIAMDESAQYQPTARDNDIIKKQKQRCLSAMTQILQEGRSSGIHMLTCLQRPSRDSFDAPMKAQIGVKICFKQPNNASSLVVLDDDSACDLRKREAIVEYDGRYQMKTLYLTPEMIKEFIKKWEVKDKKYLNLNSSGVVIEESTQECKPTPPPADVNKNSMPSISRKTKQKQRSQDYFNKKKGD